jgi:prohibitin 1
MRIRFLLIAAMFLTGCGSSALIEPGHRGLLFEAYRGGPNNPGGLHDEVLAPGTHFIPDGARVDDFDVTYSMRREPLHVVTSEGLPVDAEISIVYRPIIAELYQLDTELGPHYYTDVIGPELRAASRACFAAHSISELPDAHSKLEDEIEADVRRRVVGKHVEIATVTFEGVKLPPEIVGAIRARILAENEASKKKAEAESQVAQEKISADAAWEKEKIELERNVERRRLAREAEGK